MNTIDNFIRVNKLKPGDAILLNKKFMGMLDHFAVYLGFHSESSKHIFAANNTSGVQLFTTEEAELFLKTLEPKKIERFIGNLGERKAAVERALKMVGQKGYHLIFNNCEHYKNYVQFGKKYSSQVEILGKSSLVTGGITAISGIASGNNKALGWGLALLALGAIAISASESEE